MALALAGVAFFFTRRRPQVARVGLYCVDGALVNLPPASPDALELQALAATVRRAFDATDGGLAGA
jgi:hypothetical protein